MYKHKTGASSAPSTTLLCSTKPSSSSRWHCYRYCYHCRYHCRCPLPLHYDCYYGAYSCSSIIAVPAAAGAGTGAWHQSLSAESVFFVLHCPLLCLRRRSEPAGI